MYISWFRFSELHRDGDLNTYIFLYKFKFTKHTSINERLKRRWSLRRIKKGSKSFCTIIAVFSTISRITQAFVCLKVLATVLNGPYNIKELFILNFVTNDGDGYHPNSKITVYELIFCSYKVQQVVLWDNIT